MSLNFIKGRFVFPLAPLRLLNFQKSFFRMSGMQLQKAATITHLKELDKLTKMIKIIIKDTLEPTIFTQFTFIS